MSLPWSSKGVKATPVNADEFLIIDSADANPSTTNKRVTIGSLPFASPLTTKGDVYTFDTADARLPVGTDGQILTANSAVGLGVEWATAPSGSDTPWTEDHDAAGFSLTNLNFLESNATTLADAGSIRFGNLEAILWRNFGDTGNVGILIDGDDNLSTTVPINNLFNDLIFKRINFEFLRGTTTGITVTGSTTTGGVIVTGAGTITGWSNLTSNGTNPASSGQVSLANLESLEWRDSGNSADLGISLNASDQFLFDAELNAGNNLIKAVLDPVDGSDAATKTYVDNLINGLSWKQPAEVATTGDITLSGEQTIDGVLTSTSRVLVKDQTSGQFNGVYDTAAGAWTRTEDTDESDELVNMSIYISEGSTQSDTSWVQTTDPPIVVDTTVLVYAQVGAGAGNPLTTKGDIFGYDTGNARIPVGSNDQVLTANSAVGLGVEWQTPTVGDVVGPGSSSDQAIARFDGATGKLIQNSGVLINDSDNILNAIIAGSNLLDSTTVGAGLSYNDGVKQTFNPNATNAGLNLGAQGDPDPTSPVNGDIYYNSTNDKFRAYENGSWVDMISAGAPNAISQLNTSITVTDTGTDGLANTVIDGVSKIQSNVNRTIMNATRFELAAATTDSNISGNVVTLNNEGNYFEFNNTVATLEGISTTDWQEGSIINLRFRDANATGITLSHQASTTPPIQPLFLIGATNFQVTNANDELIFTFMWDGTNWVEINRSSIASQTPWAQDIEAATFDLNNLGNLNFSLTGATGLPAVTEPYITWDDTLTPDAMRFNVPTTTEYALYFAGVEEYHWSETEFNLHFNILQDAGNIFQNTQAAVGLLQLGRSDEITAQNASDIRFVAGNTRYAEILVNMVSAVSGSEIGNIDFLIKNDNSTTMDSVLVLVGGATTTDARINFGAPLGTTLEMDGHIINNLNQIRSDVGASLIATDGFIRMGNDQLLGWRNAGDTNDHFITFNASDQFEIALNGTTPNYTFSSTIFDLVNKRLEGVTFIQDAAQNEFLGFSSAGSAVNYIDIKNSATGVGPAVSAAGDDADVDLNLIALGTGEINMINSVAFVDRYQGLKGADIASATTITLLKGNYFDITGTTTINHMTFTGWQAGSVVILQFDASVTVTHNAGTDPANTVSFFLQGAIDFSATADDTLTLVYDGGFWRETSRSVN